MVNSIIAVYYRWLVLMCYKQCGLADHSVVENVIKQSQVLSPFS